MTPNFSLTVAFFLLFIALHGNVYAQNTDCMGQAAGTPCSNGNVCIEGSYCNGVGNCLGGTQISCAFLNATSPCVFVKCDPVQGCVYQAYAANTACDTDNNKCSIERCNNQGACINTGVIASCMEPMVCNPLTGTCVSISSSPSFSSTPSESPNMSSTASITPSLSPSITPSASYLVLPSVVMNTSFAPVPQNISNATNVTYSSTTRTSINGGKNDGMPQTFIAVLVGTIVIVILVLTMFIIFITMYIVNKKKGTYSHVALPNRTENDDSQPIVGWDQPDAFERPDDSLPSASGGTASDALSSAIGDSGGGSGAAV